MAQSVGFHVLLFTCKRPMGVFNFVPRQIWQYTGFSVHLSVPRRPLILGFCFSCINPYMANKAAGDAPMYVSTHRPRISVGINVVH